MIIIIDLGRFATTRHLSLIIRKDSFDDRRFEVSAWTDEGEIMSRCAG